MTEPDTAACNCDASGDPPTGHRPWCGTEPATAARPTLPLPERTGTCPFCRDPRRLWRVGNDRTTVLICSGCMFRAMREAQGD